MIVDDLTELLRRKQQIDADNAGASRMVDYDRWIVGVLELLLRVALENEKREHKP
jgi:hypothetical protein